MCTKSSRTVTSSMTRAWKPRKGSIKGLIGTSCPWKDPEICFHGGSGKSADVLETEIKDNAAISQEGLDHPWGTQVGRTIRETIGDGGHGPGRGSRCRWERCPDERCPKPVVINAGSGNQGITVTMPILVYAKRMGPPHDETLRALIVGDLISVYIKHYIGPLSAFAVLSMPPAGQGQPSPGWPPGITSMADTITNTLCNVGGMVCDGAKPSCCRQNRRCRPCSSHGPLYEHARPGVQGRRRTGGQKYQKRPSKISGIWER